MSQAGNVGVQQPIGLGVDQSSGRTLLNWFLLLALVDLLVSAVSVIGDGFKQATDDQAKQLFEFSSNPFVGLMVGVIATALIQSSSTVTSIIVAFVAGGLPVSIAIPMIMGSNIGTTLTNTLVSLGHVRDKEAFRRAFSAATVHDFFNLLAVVIFLPLEIMFGILERISLATAGLFFSDANLSMSGINFVKTATAPVVNGVAGIANLLPTVAAGIVMIVAGIADLPRHSLYRRALEAAHGGTGQGRDAQCDRARPCRRHRLWCRRHVLRPVLVDHDQPHGPARRLAHLHLAFVA